MPDPLAVAPHAHEDAVIHFQASQAAHFLEFRGQRRDTNTSKTVEFDFTDSKILDVDNPGLFVQYRRNDDERNLVKAQNALTDTKFQISHHNELK